MVTQVEHVGHASSKGLDLVHKHLPPIQVALQCHKLQLHCSGDDTALNANVGAQTTAPRDTHVADFTECSFICQSSLVGLRSLSAAEYVHA